MTQDEMMREMYNRVRDALVDFENASGLEVVALQLVEIDLTRVESVCTEVGKQIRIDIRQKPGWL